MSGIWLAPKIRLELLRQAMNIREIGKFQVKFLKQLGLNFLRIQKVNMSMLILGKEKKMEKVSDKLRIKKPSIGFIETNLGRKKNFKGSDKV